MSISRAWAPGFRSRQSRALALGLLCAVPATFVLTTFALAQAWTGAPPIAADLKAAMTQADTGSPDDLVKLADGGRADAQLYAGVLFIFGRGKIARDPPRGCAYVEKASASRADALYLTGQCYQQGAAGKVDPDKAKAAYLRADQLGYPQAKCALGQMLMAEPASVDRGLALCKTAATAGDADAQVALGNAYVRGGAVKRDPTEARKWFDLAAKQKSPEAARKLGEMYAAGEGGKRNTKKALELWRTAESAGDPLACILVADQLFSDITGGKKPGPGTFAFKGGVPVQDIDVVESWYRAALDRDPRPDVKERAKDAIGVLDSFKTAARSVPKR